MRCFRKYIYSQNSKWHNRSLKHKNASSKLMELFSNHYIYFLYSKSKFTLVIVLHLGPFRVVRDKKNSSHCCTKMFLSLKNIICVISSILYQLQSRHMLELKRRLIYNSLAVEAKSCRCVGKPKLNQIMIYRMCN